MKVHQSPKKSLKIDNSQRQHLDNQFYSDGLRESLMSQLQDWNFIKEFTRARKTCKNIRQNLPCKIQECIYFCPHGELSHTFASGV